MPLAHQRHQERQAREVRKLALPPLLLPEPKLRPCKVCHQAFLGEFDPLVQTVCPGCVRVQLRRSAAQEVADRAAKEQREREQCGLVGKLAQESFATFAREYQPHAYASARRFAQKFPAIPTLCLLGVVGCGKSHLAAAIIHHLRAQGVTGWLVHVPTLGANLRGAVGADGWQRVAGPSFARMREVACLVLDDLGWLKQSEAISEQFDALVNHRTNLAAPTIITANLTPEHLFGSPDAAPLLSRPTTSRLQENAEVVTLRPYDWRVKPLKVIQPPAPTDLRAPCPTCQGSGWVSAESVPPGHPNRLLQCPACRGG